jgi:hypothetical protein
MHKENIMGQNKGWVIALIVVLVWASLLLCAVVGAELPVVCFFNTDAPIPWLEQLNCSFHFQHPQPAFNGSGTQGSS